MLAQMNNPKRKPSRPMRLRNAWRRQAVQEMAQECHELMLVLDDAVTHLRALVRAVSTGHDLQQEAERATRFAQQFEDPMKKIS